MNIAPEAMVDSFKAYLLSHEQQRDFDYEAIIERLLLATLSGQTAIRLSNSECSFIEQYSTIGRVNEHCPLVYINQKLAIRRHFLQEQAIIERLSLFAQENDWLSSPIPSQAPEALSQTQQRAYQMIAQRNLLILTGGPGTGKTSTLAQIIEQFSSQNIALKIQLTAPTGKASVRLLEALTNILKTDLSIESQTIHRLLQYQPQKQCFKHHQNNPLTGDLFVIDEASMISTTLFYHLLQAIPESAKVIIAGDPFQLPAVEQGQVLKDIIEGVQNADTGSLSQSWVHLHEVFRFSEQQGIHRLSQFVQNPSDEEALDQIIQSAEDIEWLNNGLNQSYQKAQQGYQDYFNELAPYKNSDELDITRCFAALNQFRVLCAVREGPYGVYQFNETIAGVYNKNYQRYFHGLPIMITENNYDLGVFNGDMGIVIEQQHQLYVYIDQVEQQGSDIKRYPINALPAHEAAFAITVHKSQGSEMSQVLLIIPDQENPTLTTELLYTGITRAKKHITIAGSPTVFLTACQKQTNRSSLIEDFI